MAITHLTNETFESEIASGLAIVDFWATWCGPCRMQAPVLDQLDADMNGNVKVCKVDVDAEPELAKKFGVFSIPTLIAFRDGKQISKAVGLQTFDQLVNMLG